jgi:hypothetical protein
VLDADGMPVAGARLAFGHGGLDGRFSIEASWPGEARVVVWKGGVGICLSDPFRAPPGEPIDLALAPEAWLEIQGGQVLGVETRDGFPLHNPRPFVTFLCDLAASPAGPHRVRLRAADGTVTEHVVELVSGESVPIDLR